MRGRVRMWAVVMVAGLLLVGCADGSGEIEPQRTAPESIELESGAFADGDTIPTRFTCDGEGSVPPLTWSGVPEGTEQVAVTLTDPDAPGGTFVHWMSVFDSGEESADASPTVEGRNDFDEVGYGAPCPPRGRRAPPLRVHGVRLRGRAGSGAGVLVVGARGRVGRRSARGGPSGGHLRPVGAGDGADPRDD